MIDIRYITCSFRRVPLSKPKLEKGNNDSYSLLSRSYFTFESQV